MFSQQTVFETLLFSAKLRLSSTISIENKRKQVFFSYLHILKRRLSLYFLIAFSTFFSEINISKNKGRKSHLATWIISYPRDQNWWFINQRNIRRWTQTDQHWHWACKVCLLFAQFSISGMFFLSLTVFVLCVLWIYFLSLKIRSIIQR